MKVKSLSHVLLFATLWTVASQAPPSMGFSRQEYWSGLPFPFLGDLHNPGTEPALKGVKPPEAFGERSRDWSLGHAGNEGLISR